MKWFTGLLIIFNLTLLTLIFTGNAQSSTWHSGKSRSDTPLTLIAGNETREETPFTLYLFYGADGNCACLEDWPNWVDLAEQYAGLLSVKAIFNGENEEKFIGFAAGLNLPFPLYRDEGDLRNRLGVQRGKLFKALVGPRGHTLYADSNQADIRDQLYFKERVSAHMNEYGGGQVTQQ